MATAPAFNDTFLRACRGEPVDYTPVWYMRQAGRYQPEYREIRKAHSITGIIDNPDVCASVTLTPVEQLGVDAAILFADIMTPLGPMGVQYEIRPNTGPVIANPIATAADAAKLRIPDFAATLPATAETIRILRSKLSVPLIGFCGAPFTLASYLVEGGPSKSYSKVKSLMYRDPAAWDLLMKSLSDAMAEYLLFQVSCGAQALQIFDSWVGVLGPADYETAVMPHVRRLAEKVRARTQAPLIYFGVNSGHLLGSIARIPCDVVGLDWRTPPSEARARLGGRFALQGNLDPALLTAPWDVIEARARQILADAGPKGFIFNLGHGVTPDIDPAVLKRLTDFVHATSRTR